MLITVKAIINVMLFLDHVFICRIYDMCSKVMSWCQMEKLDECPSMKKRVNLRDNL